MNIGILVIIGALALALSANPLMAEKPAEIADTAALSPKAMLGKLLFFDTSLSTPTGQSCASCHDPKAGFADPRQQIPVSEGAVRGRFVPRNTPTAAYAAFVPPRHIDKGITIGGLFHDGRANDLKAQATGPLLGALEMNNPSKQAIAAALRRTSYAQRFIVLYGPRALKNDARLFAYALDALVAYERSAEVNPFSSKYDLYLAGKVQLTASEARGLKIFEDENKGNCAACHSSRADKQGRPPLFTDFSYDNLGVPANPKNPYLSLGKKWNPAGRAYVDLGLGGVTGKKSDHGKFRVPTLRNIALTAPYMHNGVFTKLKDVIAFYNSRDTNKKRWGAPEVAANVNREELGDLKLNKQEAKDLTAFLRTLSDGYRAP